MHFSGNIKRLSFVLRNIPLLLAWPVLSLVLAALLLALTSSKIAREEKAFEEDALHHASDTAMIYAQNLTRALERADQITLLLKYQWEHSGGTLRLEELIERRIFPESHYLFAIIVDRHGRPVSRTLSATLPRMNLADRDYFVFHRNEQSDALRIGTPAVGRASGKTVIQFTRRLVDARGAFDGVVVVAVEPAYFSFFHNGSQYGESALLAMVGYEGTARIATIGNATPGRPAPALSAVPEFNGPSGARLVDGTPWFPDNRARFVAWASLSSYPLVALVGLPEDELRAPVGQLLSTYKTGAMVACAFLFLFAVAATYLHMRLAWKRYLTEKAREDYWIATEGGSEGFYMWRALRDGEGNIADCEIDDCNERGANLFGLKKSEMVGKKLSQLYEKPYFNQLMQTYRMAAEAGNYEGEYRVPPESPLKIDWIYRKLVRTRAGVAVTLRDISQAKAHELELVRIGNEDDLTRLPNRHWLMTFLPAAIERAQGREAMLGLLFIDLDGFKNVNDTLGHSAGDELLQAAAMRLKSTLRPSDHVVRFGGDEFIVILERFQPDCARRARGDLPVEQGASTRHGGPWQGDATPCHGQSVRDRPHSQAESALETAAGEETAMLAAERVAQAFTAPFELALGRHTVGTSIGVGLYPRDGTDAETLLRSADMAMYSAKEAGKGNHRFYRPELYESLKRRLDIEQELLRAVREDQFLLHYQPRVDTMTGEMVGMEALVRWMHPKRGMVPPNEFIPVAEATGLIIPLGELVMHKVVAQIASWQRQGVPVVPVSVNVSARQFNEANVKELVVSSLAAHGIAPGLIEIELTESAMLGDVEKILADVASINALGVKIHIDDFGTGYSSLSLLHMLNMDVLKVDRSFTWQLGKGKEGEIFFRAIVSMAKALDMRVIAEGVETEEQLRILRSLSCDEIQGYFASRPLPPSAIPGLMRERFLLKEPAREAVQQEGDRIARMEPGTDYR
jgi:predicted signal transduction protein with EAL and GGDEF domain